ncbi:WYL domain-containing protein [Streptomyces sp. WAC05374]|uniref:helix-turn-helix transcriptional regulator n=1 Tax=Streptomyces sp. WAC05374 TaxID=2487420 RepID=UPI000F868148|nr:WYL domain-containing protein [Streptomyces sp. WAC05374]RST19594.1 WYL domain-containing protein [Streptomyces sp. WAC05374]TDF50069.1 WYL domain-containing protein [Streptomyces sp. WAC05374]TDF57795.1 WYL domain-containing protein [Streptomyces sp. WAC05374]TDF60323.1 WYL domain-containing protein [Streptomyces sp. WAC05374]
MIRTSSRLLRLVSLLSARPEWTCRELAERMAVTDRTVRRDITRLRDLGYGVESAPGPWGGYRLSHSTRMPPLVLDDEEALAVAVALREAALSGVLGTGEAALAALLKLRQSLPPHISSHLSALDGALEHTRRPGEPQINTLLLLELAQACHGELRTTLSYRDHAGRASVRAIDPYRLVHTGTRWYLVARDVAKQQWRTFRADRVVSVRSTTEPADLTDPPDAAALVSHGIANVVYPVYTKIRLPLPLDRALETIPPTIGAHSPDGPEATVVRIGGNSTDCLAAYLLSLATPLTVLSPDEVRQAILRHAQALLTANR